MLIFDSCTGGRGTFSGFGDDAGDLEPGDQLLTATGDTLEVFGLNPNTARDGPAHNLTVDGPHTYHVTLGDHPVLVHNQCGPRFAVDNRGVTTDLSRGPNLPFRDPGRASQVSNVVGNVDRFGTPPAGVAQGGLKGHPAGTFGNKSGTLPNQDLGYYTEVDVWPVGGGIKRGPERLVLGEGGEVYSRLPELRTSLRDIGFTVFEADAIDSYDEKTFIRALGDSLPFPGYFGANWDALRDCLGDLLRESSDPIALVITNSDHLLGASLHGFVRSLLTLAEVANDVRKDDSGLIQFEIFFVGGTSLVDSE